MSVLTRQVRLDLKVPIALAKRDIDQHLSFKLAPSPSRTRQPMLLFHSTAGPSLPQNILHLNRFSSSRLTPQSISSRSARFNPSGTWICSSPDASPGKSLTNTSGSSMQGCRNGSRTCHKAPSQPSELSSSSNCCIATCTFSRQAHESPTFTNMPNVSSLNTALHMPPTCWTSWKSPPTRSNHQ